MQAAVSFNLIAQSKNFDEYLLLPSLWQAIPPVDKKTVVAIVEHFSKDAWSVECCGELSKALKLSLADLTLLQPCIFLAIDNPLHFDRGLKEDIDKISINAPNPNESAIATIESVHNKENTGLKMTQHNPDGLMGIELFEHQVRFHQRAYSKKEGKHKISDHLAITPHISHQRILMSLDYHLKIQGELMADSSKAGFSLQKAAQVRHDNLGLVIDHSYFINNPKCIEQLEHWLELQCLMGRSDEISKMTAFEKELAEKDKSSPLLSKAIAIYQAKETI